MADVLRSGYPHYLKLPAVEQTPIRHMIYKSIANAVPIVASTMREHVIDTNFALAVTFGAPDGKNGFTSVLSRLRMIENPAIGDTYFLKHLQDSIELEKQFGIDGIIGSFKKAQDLLAPDAVLLAVTALFGLNHAITIEEDTGVLAVMHAPNGINGIVLIDSEGEILKAQVLQQSKLFSIDGLEYDLTGDLGVIYDVLTTQYDELLTLP